jgi:hypothetical protein
LSKTLFGKATGSDQAKRTLAMGGINARVQQRKRTLLPGKVVTADGANVFDCVIIDTSETGARIRVGEYGEISKKLFLVQPELRTAYQATVAWRRDDVLGLKLVRAYDLNGKTPAQIKPLRFYR